MSPSVRLLPSPGLPMEIHAQPKQHFVAVKISLWFFFFFVSHSCECRQISSWVPLVPSPSSSKGEGMQDPKYIWHCNLFWERSHWSSSFDSSRKSFLLLLWSAEMLYFKCGPSGRSSFPEYPDTLQKQKRWNHPLLSVELVVAQMYICMNSEWNWVVTCGGNEMRWWMRLIWHYF